MGKKKTEARRRSQKHINKFLAMDLDECSAFFENASTAELLEIVEESYPADLVNLWLDLKKSVVRDVFQRLIRQRKRIVRPVLTLYHYNEYLTNPLPLVLTAEDGEEIPNHYAIVGLPRDAVPDDIKDAQKLLLQAHEEGVFSPDGRNVGRAKLKELSEAFAVLKNEKKREEADARMPNIHYLYPRRDQSWLEAVRRYM